MFCRNHEFTLKFYQFIFFIFSFFSFLTRGLHRPSQGDCVAEKVVRMEIFGVECSILARDLSWDWLGDANERFHIGD